MREEISEPSIAVFVLPRPEINCTLDLINTVASDEITPPVGTILFHGLVSSSSAPLGLWVDGYMYALIVLFALEQREKSKQKS